VKPVLQATLPNYLQNIEEEFKNYTNPYLPNEVKIIQYNEVDFE